ncbi:MAG TPA: M14 family zinc carboxypeptidase [Blastocatellia bacterium]|nr:M14 family zinc carboxypeptidase [Blastocatellia bacterium]
MLEFGGSIFRIKIAVTSIIALILATNSFALASPQATQANRSSQSSSKAAVPTPRDVIGFTPGDDRTLATWEKFVGYFKRLEGASDRVKLQELGKTTLGRPFVLATISSPANLARLEHFKDIQRKLADPRTINSNDDEAEKLIAEGRTIVLITCGIHSTEVGANLVSMNIAYKLASEDSSETREILDRCIVLLVPSLNPDGVDIVKNWYDKTLGTAAEGTGPPELYHHYVGHDNNRDWYAFTQVETQLAIDQVHNVWHPQIVHDIHQQGESGSRFFLPPYVEPWEPNVPPIIQAGVNFMGSSMAWELIGEGRSGVVINGVYDAWTPARAYQHYHGGIRILSETASARLATPTNIPFDRLTPQVGVDTKTRSWNFPVVWPGGEWKLANIVDYMQAGAFALLRNAARYRERWLRDFYRVGKDAVLERKPGDPFAFVIPPVKDSSFWRIDGRQRILSILARGQVEMIDAPSSFEADGRQYPAGTSIIPMAQPYGAFAKTLLERQRYPDLREYPGGPPRRPYDVTAHTLPLLMGVDAIKINKPFTLPAARQLVAGKSETTQSGPEVRVALYKSRGASMDEGWTRWVFDRYKDQPLGFKLNYSTATDVDIRGGKLELKLVAKGTEVPFATRALAEAAAKAAPPGADPFSAEWETVYYRARSDGNEPIQEGWIVVGAKPVVTGLDMRDVSIKPSPYAGATYDIDFSLTPSAATRLSDATGKHIGDKLAIVSNHEVKSAPTIRGQINDRGQISGNFTKQSAEDLARTLGDLRSRFDCIIIPAQRSQQIVNGLSPDRYPAEIAGGLGTAGVDALKKFIQDGGTVITLNEASQFAIDHLGVPVKNPLEGMAAKDFYCPGSILKIKLDTTSPINRNAPTLEGTGDESVAWYESNSETQEGRRVESSLAFEPTDDRAGVVARFAETNQLLLSGWLLGAEKIAGKGAIVEVRQGKGRVVMFAFRPQYRGQSVATFPLLFNAIRTSVGQQ